MRAFVLLCAAADERGLVVTDTKADPAATLDVSALATLEERLRGLVELRCIDRLGPTTLQLGVLGQDAGHDGVDDIFDDVWDVDQVSTLIAAAQRARGPRFGHLDAGEIRSLIIEPIVALQHELGLGARGDVRAALAVMKDPKNEDRLAREDPRSWIAYLTAIARRKLHQREVAALEAASSKARYEGKGVDKAVEDQLVENVAATTVRTVEELMEHCRHLNLSDGSRATHIFCTRVLSPESLSVASDRFDGDERAARNALLAAFKYGLSDFMYWESYAHAYDFLPEWKPDTATPDGRVHVPSPAELLEWAAAREAPSPS